MTTLPNQPWNIPVNVLDGDANVRIARLGDEARELEMDVYTLICLEHGMFAFNVTEQTQEREETRHRVGEACWHKISRQSKEG